MDIILSFSAVLITSQWDGNGWVKILQQILSGMTVGWKSQHVFLYLLLHLRFHSSPWKQSNNWKLTAPNHSPYLIHCCDICSRCSLVQRKGWGKHPCRQITFPVHFFEIKWMSIASCALTWDSAWATHLLHANKASFLKKKKKINNTLWQPKMWRQLMF